MIEFWDIEFDIDELFLNEDFIESLLKLGFRRKNKYFYVKEVVNNYGELISDGLCIDLKSKQIHYFPEPNCSVNYDIDEPDVTKIDLFIRNNII
jgi:methionine aminopeptidase